MVGFFSLAAIYPTAVQTILYNKPATPGVFMNHDNTVAIYYIVKASETFEVAAKGLFEAVKSAQKRFPDWPRVLYLDIEGHQTPSGQFEEAMIELQQEFLFSTIAPFVTALETPIVDGINPNPQRNDLPDLLRITE